METKKIARVLFFVGLAFIFWAVIPMTQKGIPAATIPLVLAAVFLFASILLGAKYFRFTRRTYLSILGYYSIGIGGLIWLWSLDGWTSQAFFKSPLAGSLVIVALISLAFFLTNRKQSSQRNQVSRESNTRKQ